MDKFRFKVVDYQKISKALLKMMFVLVTLLMISVFFTYKISSISLLIIALIFVFINISIYLIWIRYYMIYESEFVITSDGINEFNLKTKKDYIFNWSDLDSFKFSEAKHVQDPKVYIKLSFKESNHTISIAEFKSNSQGMEKLYHFRNLIIEHSGIMPIAH